MDHFSMIPIRTHFQQRHNQHHLLYSVVILQPSLQWFELFLFSSPRFNCIRNLEQILFNISLASTKDPIRCCCSRFRKCERILELVYAISWFCWQWFIHWSNQQRYRSNCGSRSNIFDSSIILVSCSSNMEFYQRSSPLHQQCSCCIASCFGNYICRQWKCNVSYFGQCFER